MDDDWDMCLEQWLAGALTSDEAQRFLAQTKDDPIRLARLGRILRQQALIAEHVGTAPSRVKLPAPDRWQLNAWWWRSSAAALIVLAIAWWILPADRPLARLVMEHGTPPPIERDGRLLSTAVLLNGDTVRSGDVAVRVEFISEVTQLTCAPGSEIRLEDGAHERHMVVRHGRVDAIVAPQRTDRPMIFMTAEAQVTVVGTTLSVIADAGATAVAVHHGAVRVSSASDPDAVEVRTGQSAHVQKGQATVARPLAAGWDVPRGLIGHWPLDEGVGAVAHDVSGHGHHSRSFKASWTEGRTTGSSALSFSGQFGGEWVDLGLQDIGSPSGVTVSAWVKTTLPRYGTVFSGGFTVGAGASTIGINESEHPGADDAAGYVNFAELGNHPEQRLDSPQRINDSRWHQVAWSWTADGKRCVWIDGVLAAERVDVSERGRRWNAWYWAIGAASDRLVWNFAGAICDVRVYDRALGADDIRRLAVFDAAP